MSDTIITNGGDNSVKIPKSDPFVTKRQVGQMIRQAFERRIEVRNSPPSLDDLKNGQEVEVDLHPAQVGPGEPLGFERRRYVRRGDRLYFHVLEEVK